MNSLRRPSGRSVEIEVERLGAPEMGLVGVGAHLGDQRVPLGADRLDIEFGPSPRSRWCRSAGSGSCPPARLCVVAFGAAAAFDRDHDVSPFREADFVEFGELEIAGKPRPAGCPMAPARTTVARRSAR